jgi:hypothetical protein
MAFSFTQKSLVHGAKVLSRQQSFVIPSLNRLSRETSQNTFLRSYNNDRGSLIPIVIEQTGRGERAYDIYSR